MCVAPRREIQSGDTIGEAMRVLIEDVNDAIYDLVELIKLFQSKNKLSKVLMSTLFKRRQEELDAVVDRAVTRLHVSGVGSWLRKRKQGVELFAYVPHRGPQFRTNSVQKPEAREKLKHHCTEVR